jgi:hypothetical protein
MDIHNQKTFGSENIAPSSPEAYCCHSNQLQLSPEENYVIFMGNDIKWPVCVAEETSCDGEMAGL